ncbi:MAG TPA: hypothetical protein VHA37_06565 [Candidatus Saccharimonadales bacterium]|nr:hypothetical protein [Candidatus Saccharimonadales bacterium]
MRKDGHRLLIQIAISATVAAAMPVVAAGLLAGTVFALQTDSRVIAAMTSLGEAVAPDINTHPSPYIAPHRLARSKVVAGIGVRTPAREAALLR